MKIFGICFLCLWVAALYPVPANAAASAGVLNSAGEEGAILGGAALMYDACVKENFIQNDGPGAEQRFTAYIEKIRNTRDEKSPDAPGEIADAMQQAFAIAKDGFNKGKYKPDTANCARMEKGWPDAAAKFHID